MLNKKILIYFAILIIVIIVNKYINTPTNNNSMRYMQDTKTAEEEEEEQKQLEIRNNKIQVINTFAETKDTMYLCKYLTSNITSGICHLIPMNETNNTKCCYLSYKSKDKKTSYSQCIVVEDTEYAINLKKREYKKFKDVKIDCISKLIHLHILQLILSIIFII